MISVRCLGRWATLFVAVVMLAGGCEHGEPASQPESRAETSVIQERDVTVSPQLQRAIGVAVKKAVYRQLADTLKASGWLAARPGSEIVVKSPLTGILNFPDAITCSAVGRRVARNETLAWLHVFLSPQDEAQLVAAKEDADTVIRQSLVSLQIAQEQLKRLEQNADAVVAGTRLQQLREIVARSQAAHDEATEKLSFLPAEPYGDTVKLREVSILAPMEGHLARIDVTPGQLVLQGDPLWTIADWSKLWLRVPVFVADLPRLAQRQTISVLVPGTHDSRVATPVDWPQPSESGRQTVDLFFEIDNAPADLRPGQAVEVTLPLNQQVRRLVIPESAILWSDDGDAVVYVQTGPSRFRRRKVLLGRCADEQIVVLGGLKEGEAVVVAGAEALFGEEFRWQIPREDDEEEGD